MLRSPRHQPELIPPLVALPASDATVSSAPIAKTEPPCEEVRLYVAIDLLGLGSMEVVRLCRTGVLRARRSKHGSWWIDRAFLIQWHEKNPNYASALGCESDAEEERALSAPASLPTAPCPAGACEAHWERRGRVVPAIRAGLCRGCLAGRPLPVKSGDPQN